MKYKSIRSCDYYWTSQEQHGDERKWFFVDLVEVVLRFRFVALVEMVEVVIPVESVKNEKAHWEYQDEDDVHQPTTTE